MSKRPLSVTLISLYLLVTSSFMTYLFYAMNNNPELIKMVEEYSINTKLDYNLTIYGISTAFICAFLLFVGSNSGRWLYVILIAGIEIYSHITIPAYEFQVVGIALYVFICFLLFLPNANSFFRD